MTARKHSILVPCLVALAACGTGSDRAADTDGAGANSASNVEAHSGENVSPQLENESTTRFSVDTLSSPDEAAREQKEDLK